MNTNYLLLVNTQRKYNKWDDLVTLSVPPRECYISVHSCNIVLDIDYDNIVLKLQDNTIANLYKDGNNNFTMINNDLSFISTDNIPSADFSLESNGININLTQDNFMEIILKIEYLEYFEIDISLYYIPNIENISAY